MPRNSPLSRSPWRRRLRPALGTVLLLAALAVGGHYVAKNPEFWSLWKTASLAHLATASGALFLVMLINGIVLRELMAHSSIVLPVQAWLGVTLVTSLLNLVSPVRGGVALRAIYLKHAHGVPYATLASALSVSFAFSLAMSGGLGAASLLALGVPGGAYGWIALLFSLALVLGLVLAVGLSRPRPLPETEEDCEGAPASHWMARALRSKHVTQLAEGWRTLRRDRQLLGKLAFWNTLGAVLNSAAFVLAFRMTGFEGGWLVPVLSSAFARIGALVAITPAGLGIFEAFGAVSAQIVGAEPAQALAGVLTVRLLSVVLTVLGAAPFVPLLLPHLREEAK